MSPDDLIRRIERALVSTDQGLRSDISAALEEYHEGGGALSLVVEQCAATLSDDVLQPLFFLVAGAASQEIAEGIEVVEAAIKPLRPPLDGVVVHHVCLCVRYHEMQERLGGVRAEAIPSLLHLLRVELSAELPDWPLDLPLDLTESSVLLIEHLSDSSSNSIAVKLLHEAVVNALPALPDADREHYQERLRRVDMEQRGRG